MLPVSDYSLWHHAAFVHWVVAACAKVTFTGFLFWRYFAQHPLRCGALANRVLQRIAEDYDYIGTICGQRTRQPA